ncbi:ADP-dependent NAD(P)H-hydrate dehydratase [Candidatus Planktophila lacus]|uniref:ADP-dependent (S)-NAD(P)H-hydrate dehydratase n=1 Tax=Candidatus Planktophila lacus TaxID=1884913 RepID=A0AAD0E4B3_9ACTN|nr:ADP/ATP-dependent (S)-NAD(P)H-hydrate dehydratase [Candidatus Planktophila lacus]ASY10326.1 putative sugar kinase [Candidatus Planktophila lacus]
MKSQRWTAKDSKKHIIVPSALDHKYSRGTLGVITGSAQFPGAAVLTSKAALATGLGVLRFHSSSGLAHLVLHATPEALVQPGKVDAWLVGSGVSDKKYSDYTTWLRHRWFKLMSAQSVPTVLDAGALDWAGKLSQPTLITPHAGELAKLLVKRGIQVSSEAIEADPKKWSMIATEKLGVTVLLKGSTTYIAQPDFLIELPKATPWLATAGSGDVLAGIIGALVATNYIEILNDKNNLARVAATGAFIHNSAALLASLGSPISATSIIEFIPDAIRKILK